MSQTPPNNSAAADLLLAALQELKEMKIEVTVNIRPPGEPPPPSSYIPTTAELLPPVLTPKHIKEFLGISQAKLYEFLNSGQLHVARAGRTLYISRTVFLEWLEGRSEDKEIKRRS